MPSSSLAVLAIAKPLFEDQPGLATLRRSGGFAASFGCPASMPGSMGSPAEGGLGPRGQLDIRWNGLRVVGLCAEELSCRPYKLVLVLPVFRWR